MCDKKKKKNNNNNNITTTTTFKLIERDARVKNERTTLPISSSKSLSFKGSNSTKTVPISMTLLLLHQIVQYIIFQSKFTVAMLSILHVFALFYSMNGIAGIEQNL